MCDQTLNQTLVLGDTVPANGSNNCRISLFLELSSFGRMGSSRSAESGSSNGCVFSGFFSGCLVDWKLIMGDSCDFLDT